MSAIQARKYTFMVEKWDSKVLILMYRKRPSFII